MRVGDGQKDDLSSYSDQQYHSGPPFRLSLKMIDNSVMRLRPTLHEEKPGRVQLDENKSQLFDQAAICFLFLYA